MMATNLASHWTKWFQNEAILSFDVDGIERDVLRESSKFG